MDNGASSYRRFLDGDKEGLAELIRTYSDGLLLYVNSIVRDPIFAEDIVQDTFVKLYTDKPKFSGKSSFKTWLYSIGRYTAIRNIRRRSRHPELYSEELGDISGFDDIESAYIKGEERIQLHRAIQTLNPDYAQVLHLIYFEELSNPEAAQIMNKSDR